MASKLNLEDIYKEYSPKVRLILFRYGVGGELDDLVQETFIKVWKSLDDFKGESSLSTWIYRVTINTAKNAKRAKQRKWWMTLSGEESLEETAQTEQGVEDELTRRSAILKAFGQLSPKLREAITLYSIKELEIEEIAVILEVPTGTVKSRLHEARLKLRHILKEEDLAS